MWAQIDTSTLQVYYMGVRGFIWYVDDQNCTSASPGCCNLHINLMCTFPAFNTCHVTGRTNFRECIQNHSLCLKSNNAVNIGLFLALTDHFTLMSSHVYLTQRDDIHYFKPFMNHEGPSLWLTIMFQWKTKVTSVLDDQRVSILTVEFI